MHRLLPVLQHPLTALGLRPEREAQRVAVSPLGWEGTPALAIDGTERRRQRPTDATRQKEPYSGKKKAHTDNNLLLVNETPRQVVYLGPTMPGKTHDKKAADEAPLAYMTNATLDKDTGFQGYEPAGVLTRQPKKSPKAGTCVSASSFSIASFPARAWSSNTSLLASHGVGWSKRSCG
jgi:DDE superfamily endonuclease